MLTLTASLMGAELLLRFGGLRPWGVAVNSRWMFTETPGGTILTAPGWQGRQTVEGRSIRVRLNSLGMRGPELANTKGPEEQRVLVLGDSFVWGYGVAEEETFCHRLELGLCQSTGHPVRVGNAGAPSYGLLKQAATLRRARDSFDPDVVVSCTFVGNDFVDDLRRTERIFEGYWFSGWSARFMDVSWRGRNMVRFRTAKIIEQWLARHLPTLAIDKARIAELTREESEAAQRLPRPEFFMDELEETADVRECLARSRSALEELRDIAAPAAVLVVLIPTESHLSQAAFEADLEHAGLDPSEYRRGLVSERISGIADALGLRFLDLTTFLAKEPDRALSWQPVGKHFSILGNSKVATWLEPVLTELLSATPSRGAPARRPASLPRR